MKQTLTRIAGKLNRAAQQQPAGVFGAETHRFKLTAPATEAEVKAFEKKLKAKLPDDYRAFVTTLGASGAGPFYGLLPFEKWKEGLHFAKKHKLRALTLVDQGCANYGVLALEGEHRGRVAYLHDSGALFWPQNDSFLSWYERWLDELLDGYLPVWFGSGMPGRELDFLEALTSQDTGRRAKGAAAMHALKVLSPPSREAIIAALTDAPPVQSAAIAVLQKHAPDALATHLPSLLKSGERDVVLTALRALKETPHTALATPLIDSTDKEIARAALNIAPVDEALLLKLIGGPLWEVAHMKLRDVPRVDDRALEVLLPMLDEKAPGRRLAALVCIRVRRHTGARDALRAHLKRETDRALRMQTAQALCAIGDLESVESLVRHEDPSVRFSTAYELGSLDHPRAVPLLESLLHDETRPPATAWNIAEQARRALARRNKPA